MLSFSQTSGGSSGFVFTGYEFANGLCTQADVYYDENRDYLQYHDETVPMTAYFGQHKLQVFPEKEGSIYNLEQDERITPAFRLTCIPEKNGSDTYGFRVENRSFGLERKKRASN